MARSDRYRSKRLATSAVTAIDSKTGAIVGP
jgi:hypothetical protein